ncbi:MAG: 23S rRNA (pseudouridine(1915)-N(3))-methyltransferase RlmH [Bacteroidia bacterium]|nr:23S rRNA (pseudouridine(1915)-N(3))-methyltransferase RlmH [Bacteroidia bacterium]
MVIKFICTGKTQEAYLITGIQLYIKRLKHYVRFEFIEIDIKKPLPDKLQQLKSESQSILKHCQPGDTLIFLDDKGKSYTSIKFAEWISKQLHKPGNLIFVAGSAYGFDAALVKDSPSISLSSFTFTHQMVRLIFVEQLYRAFTIIKNEKYHHE